MNTDYTKSLLLLFGAFYCMRHAFGLLRSQAPKANIVSLFMDAIFGTCRAIVFFFSIMMT